MVFASRRLPVRRGPSPNHGLTGAGKTSATTPAGSAAACEPGPAPESSAGTPREDAPTGRDRNEGEGEGEGGGEGDVDEHGDEDDLIADFLLDVENSSDDSD